VKKINEKVSFIVKILIILLLVILGIILFPKYYSYHSFSNCYIESSADYKGFCIGIVYPFESETLGDSIYQNNCSTTEKGWKCKGFSFFEEVIGY